MPAEDPVITGRGTENEIVWDIEADFVHNEPSQIPATLTTIPGLPAWTEDPAGFFSGDWWMSPDYGVTLENLFYIENTLGKPPHHLGRYLQWRNLRLVRFDP